jgi:hypothetical protein
MRTEGRRGGGARSRCDAGAPWRGAILLLCAALASACNKSDSDAEVKECAKRLINEGYIEAPSMEAAAQEAMQQCREMLESSRKQQGQIDQAIDKAAANPQRPSPEQREVPESALEKSSREHKEKAAQEADGLRQERIEKCVSDLTKVYRRDDMRDCLAKMPKFDPNSWEAEEYDEKEFYAAYKKNCRDDKLVPVEVLEAIKKKAQVECDRKVK